MKPFIRFFAERHALAFIITATILLLGLSALSTINRDALPNVVMDEMEILTTYPGASAEDVELNLTTKIEDELKDVDGLESVVSVSMENRSNIHVKIDRGVRDADKVKRDVRNAVNRVVDMPEEVTEEPYIVDISTDLIPVIELSISSESISYGEMRLIAKDLKAKVLELNGVSSVREHGMLARELKIEVDGDKAKALHVSARDVVNAIRSRNIRASAGMFESYTNEKNIVTLAEFKDPSDVGNVIVRSTFGGPTVYIKDVAVISEGFEPENERTRVNGYKAISFEVIKKGSADIIETADAVKALAEKEQAIHAEKIIIATSGDSSRIVRNRLSVIQTNGLIGLLFVLVMLIILLSLKVALWTAMGIPIALLGAIFFLPIFDMTLSSIALAGLIIVIGIVVDDAIVVAENITRHSEMGKSDIDAAVDGATEVFNPVLTTILTTILAFSPMFFIDGVLGDFVFVIPLVVCIALVISFIESIFALPSHLISGFSGGRKRGTLTAVRAESHWFSEYLVKPFTKVVAFSLKLRYGVIVFFVALLLFTLSFAKGNIDFILFPSDASDEMDALIQLPSGSSLDATEDVVMQVESILAKLPKTELTSYVSRIGRVNRNSMLADNSHAFVRINLTPFNTRERSARDIAKALKVLSDDIDGADITFLVTSGGPPVGKPITLRVSGDDDKMRNELVDDIVAKLSSMEGVSGIDADNKKGKDQIEVKLDYEKLAELSLSVSAVAQNLRLAYDGEVATSVRYGDDDVEFRVQLAAQSKNDLASIKAMTIPNSQGRLIRMDEIAEFVTAPALSIFSHYKNKRSTLITADVDIDVMTPVEATKEILSQVQIEQWPGMDLFSDGESEETQDSVGNLGSAFLIAMVGIFFVLILLFGSMIKPLIVLSVIPFGLIGVIWAFVLHGMPMSFIAAIGVIGLTGVLVNDSLILVSYVDTLKKSSPEMKIGDAVLDAASTRFRPILITSVTTVSGLLPMAYGLGGADPFMAPMALAMGYGVLMATPLALILIPCLLMVYEDIKAGLKKLVPKKTHALES